MKRRHCAMMILLCLITSGCGSSGYPAGSLEGTIKVDGKPLPHGTISFTPLETEKGPAVTADIVEGRYETSEVPLGRVRVMIHSMEETGKMLHDADTGLDYAEMVSLVPDKFMATGVEIEVSSGSETQDFDLTSE